MVLCVGNEMILLLIASHKTVPCAYGICLSCGATLSVMVLNTRLTLY